MPDPNGREPDRLEAETNAAPPHFPRLEGNALITADGETLGPIRLLDRLYLRCGITTAEQLEAVYRAELA